MSCSARSVLHVALGVIVSDDGWCCICCLANNKPIITFEVWSIIAYTMVFNYLLTTLIYSNPHIVPRARSLFFFSPSLSSRAVIFHMRGSNVVSIYLIVLLRLGMRGWCAASTQVFLLAAKCCRYVADRHQMLMWGVRGVLMLRPFGSRILQKFNPFTGAKDSHGIQS